LRIAIDFLLFSSSKIYCRCRCAEIENRSSASNALPSHLKQEREFGGFGAQGKISWLLLLLQHHALLLFLSPVGVAVAAGRMKRIRLQGQGIVAVAAAAVVVIVA
jgi:hypothetical protein